MAVKTTGREAPVCMVVEVRVEPKQAVAVYFVAGHILSSETIYAHRPSRHIVTGDDICANSCVFSGGGGGGVGGAAGGGGGARGERRQTDRRGRFGTILTTDTTMFSSTLFRDRTKTC